VRVLTIAPTLGVGGLERVAVDLANALATRGEEVTFAAADGPLAAELDAGVQRVTLHPRIGGREPRVVADTVVRVARAIRSVAPHVVHAHNVKMTGIAGAGLLPAELGRRSPSLVGTFHGVAPGEDRAAALLLRRAAGVACVSEALARRLEARRGHRDRLSVIPNGVAPAVPLDGPARAALDAELGLDEGRPVVAAVGRLMAVKAPERFLDAARLVAAEVPETVFLVIGDGPLRAALERRAAGIDVRFLGQRPDARRLIGRADVLVVSSESEGLSVVTLEALAAGVPVVSTPATGMAELLEAGAGIVAERPDARLLAEAIVSLLGDASARAAHGAAGRALVERRHGLTQMADAYQGLFERVR